MKTNVDKYLDNETRNIYNTKTDNKVLDIKYGLTEDIIITRDDKNTDQW